MEAEIVTKKKKKKKMKQILEIPLHSLNIKKNSTM